MKNQSTVIANSKLFGLIGFICAALISSLFIYHLSNKQKVKSNNNSGSLVFPVARDIKPIQLVKSDGKPFTLSSLRNHWTLMFFGFTNCNSVCPVTMGMMSEAYPSLHKTIPNLQIVLISLDPERDTKANLAKYTHSYDPAFIGVSGKIQEVRKLQSQIGIYSARDNTQQADSNYQLQHTSSIMLFNPKGQWAGMFKFGMKPEEFDSAVKNSVTSLSRG